MVRDVASGTPAAAMDYTVLARRYRPQQFEACIGQEHVARSLQNAIGIGRVAHAYLFCGSRGVGKTSMARIFAKALDCAQGPTITPCGTCEICQSIAAGQDVDVIEIDGASNRGIDEVREIRQAVHYRPSRARYKVYIIDEVHMLTREAFNALLKTLEEPPDHAKFIFATTEPQKIPITILSRCQRFDFAGIEPERIVHRLKEIVAAEGMSADDEALELVARRAGGSMRDGQSLLDQLLAFGPEHLGVDAVHQLLGTAGDDRILSLAEAILGGAAHTGLDMVQSAIREGTQLGEWAEQMLEYFRDLMVLSVHPQGALVSMPERHRPTMLAQARRVSTERLLEMMDLLAACRSRMRTSQYGRTLLEMTLVRLCRLDQFLDLAEVLASSPAQTAPAALPAATSPRPAAPTPAAPAKKNAAPDVPATSAAPAPSGSAVGPPPPANGQVTPETRAGTPYLAPTEPGSRNNGEPIPDSGEPLNEQPIALGPETVEEVWRRTCERLGDMVIQTMLREANHVEFREPATLVVHLPDHRGSTRSYCEDPVRAAKIESVCRQVAGRPVVLRFEQDAPSDSGRPAPPRKESPARLVELAHEDPFVQQAKELLGARLLKVEQLPPRAVAPSTD